RQCYTLAGMPAVFAEVVGDAGDDIGRFVPQIAAAVAIEIDGVGAVTRRHELRPAHGAGVGAGFMAAIEFFFDAQADEVTELLAEEIRARRIIEGQRGQRVQHAVVTEYIAVARFHSEYGGNDVGGHAVALLNAVENGLVLADEFGAGANTLGAQEDASVFL